MKTMALALLIPVMICAACSRKDEVASTSSPAPAEAPADSPAPPDGAANTPPDDGSAPIQRTAYATLTPAAGSMVQGGFTLVHQGAAVSIRGEITGLEPGSEHGFHVHEVGECQLPDFQSAGGHFNPTKAEHAGPESGSRHLGDLPNAKADEDGRATILIEAEGLTLEDKEGAPTEILGKALVVHALPDDYKTQPSGGSGNRIACGVIR